MTTIGIISSSVVNEGNEARLAELDAWATQLVAGFALCNVVASMVHHIQPEPEGFAKGMNAALRDHIAEYGIPAYLLCINDDYHPNQACIEELWKHRQELLVTCPTTDYTSCPEQQATGPSFEAPRRAAFVPAICWLIPRPLLTQADHVLREKKPTQYPTGPCLFDESIGRAWFEDNLTAKVWEHFFGPQPFLIAPTAWAHHEGSRTSNAIPEAERWAARERYEARAKELGL